MRMTKTRRSRNAEESSKSPEPEKRGGLRSAIDAHAAKEHANNNPTEPVDQAGDFANFPDISLASQ